MPVKPIQRVTRLTLLVLLLVTGAFSGLTSTRVAAQATSFVSPMTGISIQTSGPWTVDPASVVQDGTVESITIEGQYEFMQVWFMPANTDLVQARDIVVDSFATTFETFVTIDRGEYGNVSYSLDMTSAEGVEFGVFSLFLGQRSSGYTEFYVYFGAVPVFASGFASAQQNVSVGGTPVFGGVDGGGLQNLLTQNSGATGATRTDTTAPPTQPAPQPTEAAPVPTQPAPAPTEATTGTTTDADGAAYVQAITAELGYIDETAIVFMVNLAELNGGDAETAVQELNRISGEWAAYPQRAAAIVAPPGFEAVDAQYRLLVQDVADLSASFNALITAAQSQDPNFPTLFDALVTDLTALPSKTQEVRDLLPDTSASGTTTETDPDSGTTTETDAGGSAEGDAYVEAVSGEITSIRNSFTDFLYGVEMSVSDNPADQETGSATLERVFNFWGGYPDVAATIVAPPGYEDVDAAYQDVAGKLPGLVTGFAAVFQATDDAGRTAALEQFNVQFSQVQDDLTALEQLLNTAGSSGTTTGQGTTTEDPPTPTPTEAAQETPTEAAQTTTPEDDDEFDPDEDLNISETGSRGQIPRGDDEDADEDEGRGSTGGGTADAEELGLVADDEYVSPQHDADVIWDDRWAFDPDMGDEPIGSNPDTGIDWLLLNWLDGDGFVEVAIGMEPDFEPGIMVEYWESDEYLEQLPSGTEVLLAESSRDRGAVLLLVPDGDMDLVYYQEAVCLDRRCETFAFVYVTSTVVDAADAIADAEEGIEVAGEPSTGTFSSRQIRRALGE
jgi:cell division septation protein DedD